MKYLLLNVLSPLLMMSYFLWGCTGGVQSGSLQSQFAGVGGAVALSPTAVRLSWEKNASVTEYQVYELSSNTVLGKTVFDNIVIENLKPDTNYTFKIVGKSSQEVAGQDKELTVRTWPIFEGVSDVVPLTTTEMEVKWDYSGEPLNYKVFVKVDSAPTQESTSNWTVSTATVQNKRYVITNVQPSKTYYVIVHATYREGEIEKSSKVISVRSNSSFVTPKYSLSAVSIGSLPFISVEPVVDPSHTLSGFKTQAFWNGNPVSDPMQGKGTLVFSESANLPIGKVENISLKFEYGSGATYEFKQVEGLTTYIKGISNYIERPQSETLPVGASFFGKALARGDFNCDGGMDLAIGVPDISLAQYGISVPGVGAVFIYYSVKNGDSYSLKTSPDPVQAPVQPGVDPQIITMADLTDNSAFGFSLAAGNLNGDIASGISCQDLAVGAPGYAQAGAAFVYFGGTKGLRSTIFKRDMPTNLPTCDGKLEGATCSSIALVPDFKTILPTALTDNTAFKGMDYQGSYFGYIRFGEAISFIGDFDANGYEDLAIGAPNAPWFGEFPKIADKYLGSVGMVSIVSGSKYGMGYARYNNQNVAMMPVFPPYPQAGMKFGSAIAGGADVDGQYRIRLPDGTLAGGPDLVIGAPSFGYPDFSLATGGLLTAPTGTDANAFSIGASNGTSAWVVSTTLGSLASSTNFYGWPQKTMGVGAAFVFYGLSRTTPAGSTDYLTDLERTNWWSCGNRGMSSTANHFSCLAKLSSFSVLYPRSNSARGFGSAVAILGDPSRYKTNSTNNTDLQLDNNTNQNPSPYDYFSDPNRDGFAEIIVSAPLTTINSKANVGEIWQYFGNPDRVYGTQLFNVNSANPEASAIPADDYKIDSPMCTGFSTVNSTTKKVCVPTVLRSSSLAAQTKIGESSRAMDVGDVNGDGIKDLVVGAPGEQTTGLYSGAVLVYPSAQGAGVTSSYKKLYTQETSANDRLGTSVAIGNFNGDFLTYQEAGATNPTKRPLMDVFAGSPYDGSQPVGVGTVHGFLSSGVSLPSVMSSSSNGLGGPLLVNEKIASFSNYGADKAVIVGDINGDGYDDAVTKKSENLTDGTLSVEAVVFYGSPYGLITKDFCLNNKSIVFTSSSSSDSLCYASVNPALGVTKNGISLPQKIRPSNQSANWFSKAVRAGDVNGDGYGDVLFVMSGNFVLYFGSRGGLQNVVGPSFTPSMGDPQWVTKKISLSTWGGSLYSSNSDLYGFVQRNHLVAGDFNGDGYSDMLIGYPEASSLPMNIANHPDGAGGWENCDSIECDNGSAVSDYGMIWVLYGSDLGYQTPAIQGLSTSDTLAIGSPGVMNMLDTEQASIKPCVAVLGSASQCQVGYLRNPVWENIPYGYAKLSHLFGSNVQSIKINSDNYDDALVSAPRFSDISCSYKATPVTDYGRIYVLYGSEGGLVASAGTDYYNRSKLSSVKCPVDAITAPDDLINRDLALGVRVGGNEPALKLRAINFGNANSDRRFGSIMSVIGDINGDGYEDMAISRPDEGATGFTYIYYGPLCPLDNLTDVHTFINGSTNIQTYFTPSSVPVGSTGHAVFTGWQTIPALSMIGCDTGPNMLKPAPLKFSVLGADSQTGERYAYGMSSNRMKKGDFNGDGIDDLLVGSPSSDDLVQGIANIGNGVVFFGSKTGLSVNEYPTTSLLTTADSSDLVKRFRPFYIKPKFGDTDSQFFRGNLSVGDVNNDGTADYMITSPFYNGSGNFKGIWLGTFFLFY